ncbi:chemotaxis protein CheW [Desulfococcaceae bacterium HSG7]|nr:chemotaxis protein CheW [Desulfococcaceae bacterium HSG7]
MEKENKTVVSKTNQYLTFKLGDEIFAIDVLQVREVLDLSDITKVPRAPEFMLGVINVRGSVVPVIDLRLKFGLPKTENTINTRIVVLELALEGEQAQLGAMADSVHEVIDMDPGQIEDPPKIGSRWRTEFIKGIGKHDDQFLILLDIDRVFSSDELALVDETGATVDEGILQAVTG